MNKVLTMIQCSRPVFGLLAAVMLGACSARRDVHLIDGRSFKVNEFHRADGFVSFAADGWEYTLPDVLLTNARAESPKVVRRVFVTTNSVYMQGHVFAGLDDMFAYLDVRASPTNVVIVQMNDPVHWTPAMRDRFALHLAGGRQRPYVGIEGYWRKE